LENLNELGNKLTAEIRAYDRDLLDKFPLDRYISYLDNYPEIGGYNYLGNEVREYCNNIIKSSHEKIMELYHKLILITLILKAKDKLDSKRLPEDINILYGSNFERIVKDFESNAPGFYKYPNDKFFKDLAICTLRMIPIGALKMHLNAIPKKILFKKGWGQFIRDIVFVLFEPGGFKPLYQMHIDSHDPDLTAQYNYEGRRRAYIRVAEILKINYKIKGVFASNWYFDPQLEEISPRLNHVRDLFVKNGGQLFYLGPSAQGIMDATLNSPTRRRLYNEGRYIPRDYMAVWPRKKIIEWANKQQHLCKSG